MLPESGAVAGTSPNATAPKIETRTSAAASFAIAAPYDVDSQRLLAEMQLPDLDTFPQIRLALDCFMNDRLEIALVSDSMRRGFELRTRKNANAPRIVL
jgi:hypothetical protein